MSSEVDIDNLKVGSCYKLKSDNTYLGRLTAKPALMGSRDHVDMIAIFTDNGKETWVGRMEDFGDKKPNYFIEVPCGLSGGRRKTQRRRKTRRSKYSRRRKLYK